MIKMVHNAILKHFLKAINIVLQVSTETFIFILSMKRTCYPPVMMFYEPEKNKIDWLFEVSLIL